MKAEERLLELNQRIHQAEENGRVDELTPLLAEDFALIQANGAKISRQEYLETIAINPIRNQRIEQPDVQWYGKNAVYTCIVTLARDADGKPARYWNMRLFRYQEGKWVWTAWQVTKLSVPKYTQGPRTPVRFSFGAGTKEVVNPA